MHVERAEGDGRKEGSFWATESLKCLCKEARSEQGCDTPGLCLRLVSLGVLGCGQAGERERGRKPGRRMGGKTQGTRGAEGMAGKDMGS